MAASVLISSEDFQRQVADAIVRSANPEKVFVFGSAARGDATSDSDLDLLIVEPSGLVSENRREVLSRIRKALSPFPVSKDILVFSAGEFAKWSQSPNHVAARCQREGRLIYERLRKRPAADGEGSVRGAWPTEPVAQAPDAESI
jgi:uncharacterized protein